MTTRIDFLLRGEHITLEALLKAAGLAPGGEARACIAAGSVAVNGAPELRRGRKVRAGDVVALGAHSVQVHAA